MSVLKSPPSWQIIGFIHTDALNEFAQENHEIRLRLPLVILISISLVAVISVFLREYLRVIISWLRYGILVEVTIKDKRPAVVIPFPLLRRTVIKVKPLFLVD